MDEQSKLVLVEIVAKDLHELTGYDKKFLRARRSYLNRDEREKFASVLNEKEVQTATEEDTDRDSLDNLSKKELLAKAKGMKLKYSNTMNERQLVNLIQSAEIDREAENEEAELRKQQEEAEARAQEEAAKNKPGHKGNFENADEENNQ